MYQTKTPVEKHLSRNTILRRHMDLPKLLDLLHSKSLYLRRADGFTDRLEGALFSGLRKSIDSANKDIESPLSADNFREKALRQNYVSCWTIGAKDNMALWQLYGGSKTSVALTTTYAKLVRCATWPKATQICRVKYVDHMKPPNYAISSTSDLLVFKNQAYGYEKEARIILTCQQKDDEKYIRQPVNDLNVLVRSVVVAPEADNEFFEAVSGLCKRYGLNAPVRRSKLYFVPI